MRNILTISILLFTLLFQCTISLAANTHKSVVINMYDSYFEPKNITIHTGEKIIWINKGKKDHTVTSDNGDFNSGHIHPGASVSYTFTKPGTYDYSCTMHSFLMFGMKGKITVK